jgi:DNA-3-methyladenine glycosylase I
VINKCRWATSSPQEEDYHDHEWGVPLHDEHKLFEFLILEGAQAGLSWRTVLEKRQAYRLAFEDFDPFIVANYDENKLQELLENPGIIRNRLKITSAVGNARAFLAVQDKYGSFDAYIWSFVNGLPIQNSWSCHEELPAFSPVSIQISQDLLKHGFKFVGKTICYAYMQAIGMVNDHTIDCFRYRQLNSI